MTIDGASTGNLVSLFNRFNLNGELQFLESVNFSSSQDLNTDFLKKLKNKYKGRLMLAVFTQDQQPRSFFDPLSKVNIKFQIYQGQPDPHKMSNYVVKCLNKLGGIPWIINSTYEPETTYFLGIDLGHASIGQDKYSNLSIVLFDNKGRLLSYRVIKEIPLNEAINMFAFTQAMEILLQDIERKHLPYPNKLIIHRDGKIHKQDLETFDIVINQNFSIKNYDVVEIIKSGFPIIAAYNSENRSYLNLCSGKYFSLIKKCYAILVTNIQAARRSATLSPIIIKHKFGQTDFQNIVEQVYWFTKVHTNNLNNSTRLPATTEKANNLAGTGNRQFISTYMA